MISRYFRVKIRPELRDQFEQLFHDLSVPLVKSQPGNVSVEIGRPTVWAPDEYVMISTWQNEGAIQTFVGEKWNTPVIPPAMKRFVLECWVHHHTPW